MSDLPIDGLLFERIPRADISYCADLVPVHRILVRVDQEGKVFVRGQRDEIEQLIIHLRHQGLHVVVNYLSLCG